MDIQVAQNEVRFVYMGGFWGTNCLVRNLAGVRSARHLGHSKSVYPCRRHRGIFHLSAHANAAVFVGPPRVRQQRESVQ
jgi:hypothetical protein